MGAFAAGCWEVMGTPRGGGGLCSIARLLAFCSFLYIIPSSSSFLVGVRVIMGTVWVGLKAHLLVCGRFGCA